MRLCSYATILLYALLENIWKNLRTWPLRSNSLYFEMIVQMVDEAHLLIYLSTDVSCHVLFATKYLSHWIFYGYLRCYRLYLVFVRTSSPPLTSGSTASSIDMHSRIELCANRSVSLVVWLILKHLGYVLHFPSVLKCRQPCCGCGHLVKQNEMLRVCWCGLHKLDSPLVAFSFHSASFLPLVKPLWEISDAGVLTVCFSV